MGWWSFQLWSLRVLSQVLCWFFLPVGKRSLDYWRMTWLQLNMQLLTTCFWCVNRQWWEDLVLCQAMSHGVSMAAARASVVSTAGQQDGTDGFSPFLNRARWHQVLGRGRQLVRFTPWCLGFCCVVTKMRTVQVVIHTCDRSAWQSACDTCFWWSAACWCFFAIRFITEWICSEIT